METYYGTKRIQAQYMPGGLNKRAGYAVQGADGRVSWLPANAFEKAYRKSGELNFGHALEALKAGHAVSRSGWNGKDLFLFYVPSLDVPLIEGYTLAPHIFICGPDKKLTSWVPSQSDQLAEDWCIVE